MNSRGFTMRKLFNDEKIKNGIIERNIASSKFWRLFLVILLSFVFIGVTLATILFSILFTSATILSLVGLIFVLRSYKKGINLDKITTDVDKYIKPYFELEEDIQGDVVFMWLAPLPKPKKIVVITLSIIILVITALYIFVGDIAVYFSNSAFLTLFILFMKPSAGYMVKSDNQVRFYVLNGKNKAKLKKTMKSNLVKVHLKANNKKSGYKYFLFIEEGARKNMQRIQYFSLRNESETFMDYCRDNFQVVN